MEMVVMGSLEPLMTSSLDFEKSIWRSEKFAFVPLVLWDVPDFHIWSFGWSLKPCKQQSKSLFNHKKPDAFF